MKIEYRVYFVDDDNQAYLIFKNYAVAYNVFTSAVRRGRKAVLQAREVSDWAPYDWEKHDEASVSGG